MSHLRQTELKLLPNITHICYSRSLFCSKSLPTMFPCIPQGSPPPLYQYPPSYEDILGPDNPSSPIPLATDFDVFCKFTPFVSAIDNKFWHLWGHTSPAVQNNAPMAPVSSITEPIEQPGTDALVASNSALVLHNDAPSMPALCVVSYEALM